jgi:hypothetical protein
VTRVNLSSAGTEAEPADAGTHIVGDRPSISADGRFVAFDSSAGNLVPDDMNEVSDIFVRDRHGATSGTIDTDTDVDGTPDCHDPASSAALKLLVQSIVATVKRLKANSTDREAIVAELRTAAEWLLAAENNASLSRKQRQLLGTAAGAIPTSSTPPARPSRGSAAGRSPSSESC